MAFLIGTDEAGYGPNLGPLVITASVWQVPSLKVKDLHAKLHPVVQSARLGGSTEPTELVPAVVVADSKLLYKPGHGLASLEQGVLTFLTLTDQFPKTWRSIWRRLSAADEEDLSAQPWYQNYDRPLPIDCPGDDLSLRATAVRSQCDSSGCTPIVIRSRAIFPPQFNELVDRYGNKSTALSHGTLELIRSVLDNLPQNEPVYVLCDKHGGRNKYGPLLHATFPDTLALVRAEGRQESIYQLGHGPARREFVFRAKGESFLPSALASMVSKYLRELAMRAFNDYWRTHVADLKPTAGYPVDARRFMDAIAPTQRKLGITDHSLWRCR